MIIDYVTGIGSYPFRHVENSTPEGLIKLMDEDNIDKALVSSFESIMYRNVQKANELLAEKIAPFQDRLVGAAIINPVYSEATQDLELCVNSFNMRAVKLLPVFHQYNLIDPKVSDVLIKAKSLDVPVSIIFRVEDERQRHWLINPSPLPENEVAQTIKNHPDINFVLERVSLNEFNNIYKQVKEQTNWFIEVSSRSIPAKPIPDNLINIIEKISAERILFATDIPLQYAKATTMKLESLELDTTQKKHIYSENAANLLKI